MKHHPIHSACRLGITLQVCFVICSGCEVPEIDVAESQVAQAPSSDALEAAQPAERAPVASANNQQRAEEELTEEDRGPWTGWEHLEEPLGDESFIEYRIVPANYRSGDQVTLEVAVGSGYGPIDNATISVRCTEGSEKSEYGLVSAPDSGEPWEDVEKEGMYELNWETNERTKLPGMKAPREELYGGYMLHTCEFAIPDGKVIIELRVQQPALEAGRFRIPASDFAFQAFPVTY